MLLVISSFRFPDRFTSKHEYFSKHQFQNINSEAGCSYKSCSYKSVHAIWSSHLNMLEYFCMLRVFRIFNSLKTLCFLANCSFICSRFEDWSWETEFLINKGVSLIDLPKIRERMTNDFLYTHKVNIYSQLIVSVQISNQL